MRDVLHQRERIFGDRIIANHRLTSFIAEIYAIIRDSCRNHAITLIDPASGALALGRLFERRERQGPVKQGSRLAT
jgi:hypothetical protein